MSVAVIRQSGTGIGRHTTVVILSLCFLNALNTESLVIGGTLYEEDANNPINEAGVSSHTYTMAESADDVIIIHERQDAVSPDAVRVNGDSGSNYENLDNTDNLTTGETEFSVGRFAGDSYVHLFDMHGSRINCRVLDGFAGTGRTIAGSNNNVTGPITQFRMLDTEGTNRDIKARVYRRSMNV